MVMARTTVLVILYFQVFSNNNVPAQYKGRISAAYAVPVISSILATFNVTGKTPERN